jgi:hypothetical protein
MSLCHFAHILHDFVVLFVNSEFFNCHDVLKDDYSTWRINKALLDAWRLKESSHCLHLSKDCIDVTITAEF